MRRLAMGILVVGICASAWAADPDVRERISAARQSAVGGLLEQINAAQLVPNLTIEDFLDRTRGEEELRAELMTVEPTGGPRWLDEKTCQVRLEVPGTTLVSMLGRIAAAHPEQTPIPAPELPRAAATLGLGWKWFTATGTSTAIDDAPPPPPDSPWSAVPPDQVRKMVQLAGSDAVQHAIATISNIPWTNGQPPMTTTLGQVIPEALKPMLADWLSARPVTAVEYVQDQNGRLSVRVTLAINSEELSIRLRTMIWQLAPHPGDPILAKLNRSLAGRIGPTVGEAVLPATAAPAVAAIPAQPPDWVANMADASGVGGPAATSLRAARAAEADAMTHLRRQVMALHLTPGQTIAQAVAADPSLGQAVDQEIARDSQLYKSDYRPDGTVEVRISLDLRLLWGAISGPQ
jgi:hypothetical protein